VALGPELVAELPAEQVATWQSELRDRLSPSACLPSDAMVSFELYPWHSTALTPRCVRLVTASSGGCGRRSPSLGAGVRVRRPMVRRLGRSRSEGRRKTRGRMPELRVAGSVSARHDLPGSLYSDIGRRRSLSLLQASFALDLGRCVRLDAHGRADALATAISCESSLSRPARAKTFATSSSPSGQARANAIATSMTDDVGPRLTFASRA